MSLLLSAKICKKKGERVRVMRNQFSYKRKKKRIDLHLFTRTYLLTNFTRFHSICPISTDLLHLLVFHLLHLFVHKMAEKKNAPEKREKTTRQSKLNGHRTSMVQRGLKNGFIRNIILDVWLPHRPRIPHLAGPEPARTAKGASPRNHG